MKYRESPSKFRNSISEHRFQQLPQLGNTYLFKKMHTDIYSPSTLKKYDEYSPEKNQQNKYVQRMKQRILLTETFSMKDKIDELLKKNNVLDQRLISKDNEIFILNENIKKLRREIDYKKQDMREQDKVIKQLRNKVFQLQSLKQQLLLVNNYSLKQYNRNLHSLAWKYQRQRNYSVLNERQKSFSLTFMTDQSETKQTLNITSFIFSRLKNTISSLNTILSPIILTSLLNHLNHCQNIIEGCLSSSPHYNKKQLQNIKYDLLQYKLPLEQIQPSITTQNNEDNLLKMKQYQQIIDILSSTLAKEQEYILMLEKEKNDILETILDQ